MYFRQSADMCKLLMKIAIICLCSLHFLFLIEVPKTIRGNLLPYKYNLVYEPDFDLIQERLGLNPILYDVNKRGPELIIPFISGAVPTKKGNTL